MTDAPFQKRLTLESPALYRIVVQGRLDESWSDRLAGMSIINPGGETGAPVTILQGRVSDQAELSGVLNGLYELHLPILLVENLTENDSRGGNNPNQLFQTESEESVGKE